MRVNLENLVEECVIVLMNRENSLTGNIITEEIRYVLEFTENVIISNDSDCFEDAFNFIDATIDKLWEKLNIGCWKDIPGYLRDLYGYTSFLKACIQLLTFLKEKCKNPKKSILNIIGTADKGLLLGSSFRETLSYFAQSLCNILQQYVSDSESLIVNPLFPFHQGSLNKGSISSSELRTSLITEKECPSLDLFHNNYFKKRKPVKLLKCMEHWPALKKWSNLNYILKKIGPRTVPVEIGSSYTSSDWSQKLLTVEDFMKQFIIPENPLKTGYLAQHQLFNQIPELREDIREPDYCIFTEDNSDPKEVDMNAWFGPSQTVSDLHYDPKHNFLAQVLGKKRVLLVDPKWTPNVYPREDHLLHNTAQIDPENPDFQLYPELTSIEVIECILNEGEMIYIPPKWWHHVRSMSVSFSVSFWWC